MTIVELYSKDDCHLCDIALDVLQNVREIIPFELQQVKIREGDEYFEKYKERIPVVFINKEFAFQYKVKKDELIAKLNAAQKRMEKQS